MLRKNCYIPHHPHFLIEARCLENERLKLSASKSTFIFMRQAYTVFRMRVISELHQNELGALFTPVP